MKAAVVEQFGSLVVRDVPEPRPGEYQVLCELLYGATCTGTDTHLLQGHPPFCDWVRLPFILGHESVGRVVELGPRVRNFRPGDLVTRVGAPGGDAVHIGWGGFAELGVATDHWAMAADGRPQVDWAGSRVNQVVPAGIDPRVAPMLTTWRETRSYLQRMGVGAGASVLIVGSGGNGLSFAAHAALLGATTVAMAGAARLAAAARAQAGVTAYVDYQEPDLAASLRQVAPGGFDYIVDAVGRADTAGRVLPCLRPGGKYGTYGMDEHGRVSIDPGRAPGAVVLHPCSYDEAETHQVVTELVLQGRLTASLWYDCSAAFPLSAIRDAFAHVWSRRSPKALVQLRA